MIKLILWMLFCATIFMLLVWLGAYLKGINFVIGDQLFQVYVWSLFAWFCGLAFGAVTFSTWKIMDHM